MSKGAHSSVTTSLFTVTLETPLLISINYYHFSFFRFFLLELSKIENLEIPKNKS